jgi:hypothetical protein
MLTQMPAFISVNRSERLPTSAGEQLRQPERVEGRPPVPQWVASQVRPDLERAPQRLQATFGKAIICEVRSSSSHMPIPILDFRMKTTLNIDDRVMAELKREASRQGRTMSELVETALRLLCSPSTKAGKDPCPSKVPQRRSTRRRCRPRCPVPRHGGSLVPSIPMCWSTPPMRTRNFIPPAATGSSDNGRERMLGTLLGRSSRSFCA